MSEENKGQRDELVEIVDEAIYQHLSETHELGVKLCCGRVALEAVQNAGGVVGMPLHESSTEYDLAGIDEDGDVIPYVNVLKS